MKIVKTVLVLLAFVIAAGLLTGCASGDKAATRAEDPAAGEEALVLEEPVKSFLLGALPDDYSFYTLSECLPVAMEDLRAHGLYIGSRVPPGLLPDNVISQLYGGGFVSGTMLTMGEGSDGMDKFDGIKLKIAIGISPDGCVNAMRDDGAKIILLSDDAANEVNKSALIKISII